MKKYLLPIAAVAAISAAQAQSLGDLRLGIVIESESVSNSQEAAALNWIKTECPTVKVYTPANVATLSNDEVDAVWVHVDRVGIESGWHNLPAAYSSDATVNALKSFHENGGALLLSKHATQLATAIGVIDKEANCFGSGDGGEGFDNWTIQAVLGAAEEFESLDRTGHAIFEFMETCNDFGTPETYPLLGTGDAETSMWREDHNCFWIPADLGFGEGNNDINCIRDFEKAYNCTVLGTWGHVKDYCGAGIIDFGGNVITIGLAAYELAPRSGVNAYTDNIDLLTSNSLRYLAEQVSAGINDVAVEKADATPVYFNLQGIRVANPQKGNVYIVRTGNVAKKVVK